MGGQAATLTRRCAGGIECMVTEKKQFVEAPFDKVGEMDYKGW